MDIELDSIKVFAIVGCFQDFIQKEKKNGRKLHSQIARRMQRRQLKPHTPALKRDVKQCAAPKRQWISMEWHKAILHVRF